MTPVYRRFFARCRSAIKAKAGSSKTKATPIHHDEDDVDMHDGEVRDSDDIQPDEDDEVVEEREGGDDEDEDEDGGDDDDGDGGDGDDPGDQPPPSSGLDESAVSAIFGADLSASFGSYIVKLSSRLKTILNNIKAKGDPTARLIALQELSEILSMSTEEA